ncbi:uncharacterized protein N7477_008676 [Penicillium maclennaniae]|uniref:uncharacterized protein n=1 Tax=Penicillium maclennaniae TaxID=1343394 RepID=UPI00253FAF38|nr:uncharacterized protein N7477_008676 [Penicillium maclennaniae]KAJ5666228.1 hypothetical protein N7477_008676 [Penicillium maclennaniae]
MSAPGSPRNVLKTSLQTAYAAASAEQPSSLPTREEQDKFLEGRPRATTHHLGIALQHAHQIQAQKDAEGMILDRIIELLALPSSPSADPATPSPQDAQLFKSALYPFRPSDYDSLVEERNNEDLCGYGLCPRKNRKDNYGRGQSFRFKYGAKGSGPGGRGRSVNIVPSDNIEKWCSDQCAERALYIRVQLGEKPVWERRANDTHAKNIQLLEEGRAKSQKPRIGSSSAALRTSQLDGNDHLTAGMKDLNIQDSERSEELALERGDTGHIHRHGRVGVHVKENELGKHSAASAPQPRPEDALGGSIEGYVPLDRRDKASTPYEGDLLDQI